MPCFLSFLIDTEANLYPENFQKKNLCVNFTFQRKRFSRFGRNDLLTKTLQNLGLRLSRRMETEGFSAEGSDFKGGGVIQR